MEIFLLGLLSGISYGVVLFLIAIGLSLVLGFMGMLNLAHGAVFMVGGFVGLIVAKETENLIFGILAGALASGMLGLLIERGFLRHLHKKVLEQILVTFGFIYIITNATLWIWGTYPQPSFIPSILAGSISTGEFEFPIYRLALIIAGTAICFGLWWLQEKTRIGSIVRAGMDDAQMTSGLGINLTPINIGTFFLGAALAGIGAVLGAPVLGFVDVNTGSTMLFVALTVVIVGGVGSVQGSLAGALLIGIVYMFTNTYYPPLAIFTVYLLLVIVLLLRPRGLLGRKV